MITARSIAAAVAIALLSSVLALPAFAQDTPTLLVLRPKPKARDQSSGLKVAPVVQSDVVEIKIGGKPAIITAWTPLLNGPTTLQLVVLIDSQERIGVGNQFDDIRNLFASLPFSERPTNCLLQEDGSGRVFVDPATMQIKRMELTAPHHTVFPGGKTANGFNIPPIIGVWDISVDYSPVLLGGQSFWLPATITSRATSSSGVPSKTVWSFLATYRNYHKLEVTSRILPFDGQPVPQPRQEKPK